VINEQARRTAGPQAILVLALAGISFAGPLVRLSHAHPLAIAIWRLGFSLVVIAIALVLSGTGRQLRTLTRRDFAVAIGAGVMLAIHFWSWNASISMTSVAASVVLVNMQPAMVALLSVAWLREAPNRRQWIGIAIAMIGALVVAAPEVSASHTSASGRALVGDLLALLGAATGACYYVAGRRLRATLDLWPYVAVVYGACFVVLILFAGAVNAPVLDQPPREIGIFAALAIGPMMLGHTGFNWALRYVPAYVVNLVALAEPVGATLLAALLPGIHELPSAATVAGGALILAGVYGAARKPGVAPQRAD
jgi:drug/metabolite transporter (DMT)-like permease